MSTIRWLTAIAGAAVLASGAGVASAARSEHGSARSHERHAARADAALREVSNASLPDQASYGWQYFSDPRAVRAVVISPSGEYFLSRGDGPRQVTGPAGRLPVPQRD